MLRITDCACLHNLCEHPERRRPADLSAANLQVYVNAFFYFFYVNLGNYDLGVGELPDRNNTAFCIKYMVIAIVDFFKLC